MKTAVCAMDFGTSNTTMAIVHENKDSQLVNLEGDSPTLPSAIFFRTDDVVARHVNAAFGRSEIEAYRVELGKAAIDAYLGLEEGRLIRSFKRALGTSLMKEGTLVGDRWLDFPDMATIFVRDIKARTELAAQQDLKSIVVGRPVHFVDGDPARDDLAQSQLTEIFQRAGFRDIHFQYEPIAGAFAHERHLGAKEKLAVVLDIGGGTSDFSIVRLSSAYTNKADRSNDILGSTGLRVGGNDFDRSLSLSSFMPEFGMGSRLRDKDLPFPAGIFHDLAEWSRIQFAYAPKQKREVLTLRNRSFEPDKIARLEKLLENQDGHRLLGVVEQTKIELGQKPEYRADLGFIERGLENVVSRSGFEEAISSDGEKIRQAARDCVRQANLKNSDIDLVILTGGGTGIPLIQRIAKEEFPQAEVSSANMMTSVGVGLGYEAQRVFFRHGGTPAP